MNICQKDHMSIQVTLVTDATRVRNHLQHHIQHPFFSEVGCEDSVQSLGTRKVGTLPWQNMVVRGICVFRLSCTMFLPQAKTLE